MKRIFAYISTALSVLVLLTSVLPASAATPGASSGLSINPRKNYVINPGQSITDKLTIGNLNGKSDLNVTLKMIDFTFLNDTGTPKLMLADNAPTTTWSLKPYTTLPPALVIPAGQSRTVSFSIKIPKNQGAGSFYSAIEYASTGANGGNVNLNASGVTLVFVSIPGTVSENLSLKKFGAYHSPDGGTTGSFVFISTNQSPERLAYTLANSGNVAENPTGSIILKDMFGHQVKVIDNININSSLALLGQTRLFTTCISTKKSEVPFNDSTTTTNVCVDPHFKPGRYTALLDVFYGQNGNRTQEITATATFWYLPWWLIIAAIVVLLLLIGTTWWTIRRIKGGRRKRTFRR